MMINGHSHNADKPEVRFEEASGWKIRFEFTGDGCAFAVFQIVAKQESGLRLPLYMKEGTQDGAMTPNWIEAEAYMTGAVKPDGRVFLSGNSVFIGALGCKLHFALIRHLYERSFKLMKKKPKTETAWEDAK